MEPTNSGPARQMPRYKCHKEVWALQIKEINQIKKLMPDDPTPDAQLSFEEEGYAPITVTGGYMDKHEPKVGGYYIVYEDGYKSFSPAEAFEEGYTLIEK